MVTTRRGPSFRASILTALVAIALAGQPRAESPAAAPGASEPPPLRGYGVDIDQTSVSGVSSGGAMAIQMHVAHSSIMRGVGVTGGIAYDCANSDEPFDTKRIGNVADCMNGDVPVARSKTLTDEAASSGDIDSPDNLGNQKVWLLYGAQDVRVNGKAMESVARYYEHYAGPDNVAYNVLQDASHAQITDDFGAHCPAQGTAFISDCDYDSAGELLRHIYDDVALKSRNDGELSGAIKPFDQAPFVDGDPTPYGLARTGYLYVPASCEAEAGEEASAGVDRPCRVHVAFHGCKQSAEFIEDAFYMHAGYNEWADNNDIIVLYPQTTSIPLLGFDNLPEIESGCWDWFGYSGFDRTGRYDKNFANKKGFQVAAIRRMLDCLAKERNAAC